MGYVEIKDFESLLLKWFPQLDENIRIRIIRKMDMNKDGIIDLDEFVSACCAADLVK